MKRSLRKLIAVSTAIACIVALSVDQPVQAQGRGGRGGGGGGGTSRGGGGGGMSRGGGGGGGARPSMGRPGGGGGGRPSTGRPGGGGPSVSRPNMSRPSGGAGPGSRPSMSNMGQRPTTKPANINRPSMGGVSRPNASLPSTRPGALLARDPEQHVPAPAASPGPARRPPRRARRHVRRHRRDLVEVAGFPETSGRIVRASARVARARCRLAPAQVARLRIVRASARVAPARSRPARVRVAQSGIDRVRAVVIDPAWVTSRGIAPAPDLVIGRVSAIGPDGLATGREWAIGLVDGPAIGRE